jgi:hypothetical protein
MGSILFLPNQPIIPATALTADITGDMVNVGHFTKAGFQVVWAGLTGTVNATVSLQVSNDNVNWDNATTTITLSGTSGNDCVAVSDIYFSYCRAVVAKNNVTGGTISVTATFKE